MPADPVAWAGADRLVADRPAAEARPVDFAVRLGPEVALALAAERPPVLAVAPRPLALPVLRRAAGLALAVVPAPDRPVVPRPLGLAWLALLRPPALPEEPLRLDLLAELPAEPLRDLLAALPAEALRDLVAALPAEALRGLLAALAADDLPLGLALDFFARPLDGDRARRVPLWFSTAIRSTSLRNVCTLAACAAV